MSYCSISPHPALASYIDAYWSVKGNPGQAPAMSRILPDGCVDIILNRGEDNPVMQHGKAYLIGTMTRPIDSMIKPGTDLLGVRFKPGAFSAFYSFSSLHEVTDALVEWEEEIPLAELNKFFLDKLAAPKHSLFPLLETIGCSHGMIRVEALARQHFITIRQLERSFRYHIGTSPKEFINQVRFRYALARVRGRQKTEGLSEIAWQCGYYDPSHLVHAFRKYTGDVPGAL